MKAQRPYLLRALYEWIVDSDEVPYVLVDATAPGVQVPTEHVENDQIVLNLGPNAVKDLHFEDDYVMCGGRFSGRHFELCLPMASILAIYAKDSQQGMVFPDEANLAAVSSQDIQGSRSEPTVATESSDSQNPESPDPDDKPTLRLV